VIARASGWVYLVSDRRRLLPSARTDAAQLSALEAQVEEAMTAGVDVVQLRERDLDGGVLCALARRVLRRAAGGGTRILINDRADVAAASRAHGVHVRGDGPAIARVRTVLPEAAIIGRSVHSVDEVHRHGDADYLMFGSVFATESKPGGAATGLEALREATIASHVPVVAIGGITAETAAACIEAGARGLAAIGMFLPPGRAVSAIGIPRAVAMLRAAFLAGAEGRA
jgi:thiamine-phosphate pyrophosphorylase